MEPYNSERILIVSDVWKPQINGLVTTLTAMCNALNQLGHTTKIISFDQFPNVGCPMYPDFKLAHCSMAKMGALIENFAPTMIHIATELPVGIAARRYCLRQRLNFTSGYYTRLPEYVHLRVPIPTTFSYSLMRRFHAPSSRVLVPSESMRNLLHSKGFHNLAVSPPGIDTQLFQPYPVRLPYPGPIHLYVGRITTEKNLPAFLDLKLPGSKVVVGEGTHLDMFRKRYPDVHFVGKKSGRELAEYYAGSDVFVFPSRTDTFGMVLLEALACGLPVAAYNVTGPRDAITDPNVGSLTDDLELSIKNALSLSRAACRQFAERFSWTQSARIFLSLQRHTTASEPELLTESMV